MPPRKRASSVLSDDNDDLPEEANRVTDPDDALAAAEEADAEAAEAEAQAAAARARARAIRLRRQAAAAATAAAVKAPALPATVEAPATLETPASPAMAEAPASATVKAPAADVESSATELDEPAAEATAEETETVEDYPAEPARRSRGVLKIIAAALVIVASAAFLGIGATIVVQHRHVEAQRQQAADFEAAARQGAVTLMSLNYNTAKDDVQRIIDNTTGDFKKNFEDQKDDFVKVAQSSKAVTTATVTGVAIQKMTKDTATALVTVTTRVSNLASDKQDPRAWRLSVDLARDGGQIKLAKVEFVP